VREGKEKIGKGRKEERGNFSDVSLKNFQHG
jgi:hypothetical protein